MVHQQSKIVTINLTQVYLSDEASIRQLCGTKRHKPHSKRQKNTTQHHPEGKHKLNQQITTWPTCVIANRPSQAQMIKNCI